LNESPQPIIASRWRGGLADCGDIRNPYIGRFDAKSKWIELAVYGRGAKLSKWNNRPCSYAKIRSILNWIGDGLSRHRNPMHLCDAEQITDGQKTSRASA
jgi:hypothetical protein